MDSYTTSHPSTSLHSMFMRIFMLAPIAKDSEEFRAPGVLSVMMMKTGPWKFSLKSTGSGCLSREVAPPAVACPSLQ